MNKIKVSIIVAVDDKNGIGKDNELLWHIPEELKRFKEITTGHPIIMGRKTHESIGRSLPNRINIVITRDRNYRGFEGAVITNSLEDALSASKLPPTPHNPPPDIFIAKQETQGFSPECFIIGGGEIYKQALEKDLVDKIYLTKVEGDFNATVFFPDYSKFRKVTYKSDPQQSSGYTYVFLELEK